MEFWVILKDNAWVVDLYLEMKTVDKLLGQINQLSLADATGVQRALFLPLKNVASTTLPDRVHSVPNWEASIPIEFWTVLPTYYAPETFKMWR